MISKRNILFLSLTVNFVLADNPDPDQMSHHAAFHLDLLPYITVCPSTYLGVSSMNRVKQLFEKFRVAPSSNPSSMYFTIINECIP